MIIFDLSKLSETSNFDEVLLMKVNCDFEKQCLKFEDEMFNFTFKFSK